MLPFSLPICYYSIRNIIYCAWNKVGSMKKKNLFLSVMAVVMLMVSFSSTAMHGGFGEAPGGGFREAPEGNRESNMDQNEPRKNPDKGGWLSGICNFFSPKSGKDSDTTQSTGTQVSKGSAGSSAGGDGTMVAGDSAGGDEGVTAFERAAIKAAGKEGFSHDVSTDQAKERTQQQKEELVNNSDLSLMQKAIVKSLAVRTNNVELLIRAMKDVETEIVNAMTGTKVQVKYDQTLTENDLVIELKKIQAECYKRLDGPDKSDLDKQKIDIVNTLLHESNAQIRKLFFERDIAPKVRAKKTQFRSKGGGR